MELWILWGLMILALLLGGWTVIKIVFWVVVAAYALVLVLSIFGEES